MYLVVVSRWGGLKFFVSGLAGCSQYIFLRQEQIRGTTHMASLEATPRGAIGFNKGGIIIIGYYDGERIIDPRFRHLS